MKSSDEVEEITVPPAKRYVPGKGPIVPSTPILDVVMGSPSTMKEATVFKLSAEEFLQKLGYRMVGGEVVHDPGTNPTVKATDPRQGLLAKVENGVKDGDPCDSVSPSRNITKMTASGPHVHTNEGPKGKAHRPMDNSVSSKAKAPSKKDLLAPKHASALMRFYSAVLEKLSVMGAPSAQAPTIRPAPTPGIGGPVPQGVVKPPMPPAAIAPAPPMSVLASLRAQMKEASAPTGSRIGSPDVIETARGLVTGAPMPPLPNKNPKGSALPY